MNFPKISLIIPCFKAAETIERTIKSVIAQNYPNLELILVDGGSTDGTVEIARKYSTHFGYLLSESDKGQAHAINKGFNLATGDIIAWLCADDELLPNALVHVAEMFEKHPEATMLTGACERYFSDGTVIQTKPDPKMWSRISYQNGIEQPSTFWRARLNHAAGELDESYVYAFDWDWWNRLKLAGANLVFTTQVLSRYHFSKSNKTSNGARAMVEEMYRVVKTYGPLDGRLADIYMFLYKNFDLNGYYDRPPKSRRVRAWFFRFSVRTLTRLWGQDFICRYNWNFASKQERNLCWYK